MTDNDLDVLLREVAEQPHRAADTAMILLATFVSATLWFAASWLAVTW